jgi:hypothetical protein
MVFIFFAVEYGYMYICRVRLSRHVQRNKPRGRRTSRKVGWRVRQRRKRKKKRNQITLSFSNQKTPPKRKKRATVCYQNVLQAFTSSSFSALFSLLYAGLFRPSPRTHALLAVKGNTLYLYGGIEERGEIEVTLRDFYSLNLAKLDRWEIIIPPSDKVEWLGEVRPAMRMRSFPSSPLFSRFQQSDDDEDAEGEECDDNDDEDEEEEEAEEEEEESSDEPPRRKGKAQVRGSFATILPQ